MTSSSRDHTNIPSISTRRVLLRGFNKSDLESLHRILSVRAVLRYFPSDDTPSIEQVRRLIERHRAHWMEHGYGWWALTLAQEQKLIGWCGLNLLPATNEVELKYLLSEDHWGKGLATEAAGFSLRYGFEQAELEQIIGIVHPENIASQRVLEKVGMVFRDRTHYFGMECYRYTIDKNSYWKLHLDDTSPGS